MQSSRIATIAAAFGFELAGVTPAVPLESEAEHYLDWVLRGQAGRMSYLTDHRAVARGDPRSLLPSARSIICVARLYNSPESGPVARYARTEDYHDVIRRDLESFVAKLREEFGGFEYRICVDTAPLLERSYARQAGLGWIGRNTCLINQQFGSYTWLAEVLISLDLGSGVPAPDRCGTCTRCIDACPTNAIVPGGIRTEIDSTKCISYLTIELKGDIEEDQRPLVGSHAFGCDICQEVCPWNRRAPVVSQDLPSPDLLTLASLSPAEFREQFRNSPVWRSRYRGMLRNVAVALGNSGDKQNLLVLQQLAESEDAVVASHAAWAVRQLVKEENS